MAEPAIQSAMPTLSAADSQSDKATKKLPKLSTEDFQTYNRLAVVMDYYHNNFRRTWSMMYKAASSGQRPAGISIRGYINAGLQFCSHVEGHHGIEEAHIFPELAKRMPMFAEDDFLKAQHREIHAGLEKTRKYLEECRSGERELRLDEMKDIMDSYGKVLWEHLDEEVRTLGAESMRQYWTKDEILAMNW